METWPCKKLIGDSAPMTWLREFIGKVAPSDATVLIQGESGTGKELVARALHDQSSRSTGEFVAINCGALTESIAESTLFGHERGAFTGAAALHPGKFQFAHNGTLFLDEVGELSLAIQAKLLRAIQERVIDRMGALRPIPVNVRLIAATNRDLKLEVAAGRFRLDLYHRLKVICLPVPPLRDHPEDIMPLVKHFLDFYARQCHRSTPEISPEAVAALQNHEWSGNVRELEHVTQTVIATLSGETVEKKDLPIELIDRKTGGNTEDKGFYEIIYDAQCDALSRAFAQACGDYRAAAKMLKLPATDIHRLLKRLNLRHLLRREPRGTRGERPISELRQTVSKQN